MLLFLCNTYKNILDFKVVKNSCFRAVGDGGKVV